MARRIGIVLLLGLLLFFVNLGVRDFWAPDEGDFAQIVRELDDDLIVPHLNAAPYAEKPPFFYYVSYAGKKALSFFPDELSLRIPTALSALLTSLFFLTTVTRIFGPATGLTATIVLMTAPLFYWQARFLQVDMLFATFIVSALLAFLRFCTAGRPLWLYPFFLFVSLAFMTKGPLAIALVGPIAAIYLAARRDWRMLRLKECYLGVALALAIILPWYLAIWIREGLPFLQENVVRQNFTRFFEAWSHRRPFYYYLTTLPLDFFPWSLLLPPALYAAAKRWKSEPNRMYFLVWFGWMLLFLSLSSGKISKYMLPALPALALLVTLAIPEFPRWNRWALTFTAGIFLASGVGILMLHAGPYAELSSLRYLFAPLVLLLAFVLGAMAWKRDITRACWVLACGVALLYFAANLTVYEKWNLYKSPRPMGRKIAQLADGNPWVYYGSLRGVYVYYAGRPALHVDEGQPASLASLGKRLGDFYLLARRRDIDTVRQLFPEVEFVAQDRVGDTPMVIVRVRARP